MRKLKLQMQLSLDGYVAGSKGELDWLEMNWDDELKNYVMEITSPVDCILLGRKLAEGFIPTWASMVADHKSPDEFALKMVNTPKIVYSKSLQKSIWENARLENGDLVQTITQLQCMDGKDIMVYGGANFVSSLINAGLIDEFHLFINPSVIGNGMSIFKSLEHKLNLTLVTSKSFSCGIVLLCYQRKQD